MYCRGKFAASKAIAVSTTIADCVRLGALGNAGKLRQLRDGHQKNAAALGNEHELLTDQPTLFFSNGFGMEIWNLAESVATEDKLLPHWYRWRSGKTPSR